MGDLIDLDFRRRRANSGQGSKLKPHQFVAIFDGRALIDGYYSPVVDAVHEVAKEIGCRVMMNGTPRMIPPVMLNPEAAPGAFITSSYFIHPQSKNCEPVGADFIARAREIGVRAILLLNDHPLAEQHAAAAPDLHLIPANASVAVGAIKYWLLHEGVGRLDADS